MRSSRTPGKYRNTALAWLFLLLGPMLAGCQDKKPEEPLLQQRILVFGTVVDVTIYGADPDRAHEVLRLIQSDFQQMHSDWHAWKPGALTDLNRALAEGRPATVREDMLPLLRQAQGLSLRSDSLFNPAIGKLVALWGFHADERPSGPPPAAAEVAALTRLHPTMADLQFSGNELRSKNRAVQLDFGGIAKGYAVDLAIARLREAGIRNAIVNAGGDLHAIGRRGDRPWRVGIRHPQGDGLLASLDVEGDVAVFTSGVYERYREGADRRYAHIIDPRDGMPVEHIVSATVIHGDGVVADAAATALVVAGPQEWHRIAHQLGIKYAMVVDEHGTVHANAAMLERLKFADGAKPAIVVSPPL